MDTEWALPPDWSLCLLSFTGRAPYIKKPLRSCVFLCWGNETHTCYSQGMNRNLNLIPLSCGSEWTPQYPCFEFVLQGAHLGVRLCSSFNTKMRKRDRKGEGWDRDFNLSSIVQLLHLAWNHQRQKQTKTQKKSLLTNK